MASSTTIESSKTRFTAELNPVELKILQYMAVVALYRTNLRDKLRLKSLLELIDEPRDKQSLWKRMRNGIAQPRAEAEPRIAWRNDELSVKLGYSGSAGWNYMSCNYGPSNSSCDVPDTLRMLIHDLQTGSRPKARSTDAETVLVQTYSEKEWYIQKGTTLSKIAKFASHVYASGIWMEDKLPFSHVITKALFDDDDDERMEHFRLLMILLPRQNRNIIEVIISSVARFASESAHANAEFHSMLVTRIKDPFLALHPQLPEFPFGDVRALFRIPIEGELALNDKALVDYFSEDGIDGRELLRRCDSYLDMHWPTLSLVSTLEFTTSMWSTATVVEGRGAGDDGKEMVEI